jgi:hypothetical protein
MSIMITGVSVAQSAPVGTVVGYLRTFTAGVDQAGVMRIWRIE